MVHLSINRRFYGDRSIVVNTLGCGPGITGSNPVGHPNLICERGGMVTRWIANPV